MAGDGLGDVGLGAEVEQERQAGVPQVVEPDLGEGSPVPDGVEVPGQVSRLDRRAEPGGED
jgi:hypothetical protein